MGAEDKEGIYVISVIGSTIRKLRDDAVGAAVSHDGSKIAFSGPDSTQLWIMNIDGQQARPVVTAAAGTMIGGASWSDDGLRLAYGISRRTEKGTELSLETRDANGANPVVLYTQPPAAMYEGVDFVEYHWLPGGRIVLSRPELPPQQHGSNLWEIRLNTRTGQPEGGLRPLTDWTGFSFASPTATADGKQLLFLNRRVQSDVYVGEIDPATGLVKRPERLTLNERFDLPSGWTRDGNVLFSSDRAGNFDLYRQELKKREADPLLTSAEQKRDAQPSPDGKWLIFLSSPGLTAPARLMRLPITGGAPEPIFDVKGIGQFFGYALDAYPSFRCPTKPGASCVIAEREGDKISFSTFDVMQGRKATFFSVTAGLGTWDLSPDGKRLATAPFARDKAVIQFVTVNSGVASEVPVKGWARLIGLWWAAEGNAVFALTTSSRASSLVRVTLNGDAKLVYTGPPYQVFSAFPSPDGRHIAFGYATFNSNVWRIPSLPE